MMPLLRPAANIRFLAFVLAILLLPVRFCLAQGLPPAKGDSLSKFDRMNQKMEALFRIFPVPIYSHSVEAGHVFGLAKQNLIELSKNDTVSAASKISEVATFSTEGRINISLTTELNWHHGKYMVVGFFNYRRQPEYILGIGNDVSRDNLEKIAFTRFKLVNYGLMQVVDHVYVGVGLDLSNYSEITADSNSFLYRDHVTGIEGGTLAGLGLSLIYDSRDNRYNAHQGCMLSLKTMTFPDFLKNQYNFSSYTLDVRKYFNPWLHHVIALQATTSFRSGNVPFYELCMLGGEAQMRGYYQGALRDKVLADAQIEYRMPVWNIFGLTAWVGTGRVADRYAALSPDGLWLSYGGGLRIRVDSKHDTNMRFDFGFGPGGIHGYYINFGEAF
jgi:outer membrane protein assembly factor BamA